MTMILQPISIYIYMYKNHWKLTEKALKIEQR